MRKYLLFITVFISAMFVKAQQASLDALQQLVQAYKDDTLKLAILDSLCTDRTYSNKGNKQISLSNAFNYAHQGLYLAQKLNSKKGIAKAYYNLAKIYFSQKCHKEAERLYNMSLDIRKQYGSKLEIALSEYAVGNTAIYTDYLDTAKYLVHYRSALRIFEELGKKPYAAVCQFDMGWGLVSAESYTEALKYLFESLRLFEEVAQKNYIPMALQQIGASYHYIGDQEEALKYYLISARRYEEVHNQPPAATNDPVLVNDPVLCSCTNVNVKVGLGQVYNCIGEIYLKQEKYAAALRQHHAALKLFEEVKTQGMHIDWGIPWSLMSIANVRTKEGDLAAGKGRKAAAAIKYLEAERDYSTALELQQHMEFKDGIAEAYIYLGGLYTKTQRYAKADRYLDQAERLFPPVRDKEIIRNYYYNLSALDSIKGRFQKAYEHYKLYIAYRDSLVNEENTRRSVAHKLQYEFDKKEALRKAEQTNRDALAAAEIEKQKLVRNFSISGTVLILSLSGFGVYRHLRRRKRQSEQEMLRERLRISRELHDDIGSTLSSISIYSEVARNRSRKKENPEEALSRIGTASRELIEKMSDIVWSMNPTHERVEHLLSRMQAFAAILLSARDIRYTFHCDEAVRYLQLTAAERKNIYLLFKEALHNSVKYARCSEVTVRLSLQQQCLQLFISDNGVGFKQNENSEEADQVQLGGNGLKNMQVRVEEIGATLCINSVVNKGTTLIVALPV